VIPMALRGSPCFRAFSGHPSILIRAGENENNSNQLLEPRMRSSSNREFRNLAMACLLAANIASELSFAEPSLSTTASPDTPVPAAIAEASNYWLCWHTGTCRVASSEIECGPGFVAQENAETVAPSSQSGSVAIAKTARTRRAETRKPHAIDSVHRQTDRANLHP
jgi:hypothetical protein